MYVTRSGYTYYRGTGQYHTRAPYVILASDDDNNLYACVRQVALQQCGHFMMGTARIAGQSITVSGGFGHDGLPLAIGRDIPQSAIDRFFTRVPQEIAALYWSYDGYHRGAGHARELMAWLAVLPGAERGLTRLH